MFAPLFFQSATIIAMLAIQSLVFGKKIFPRWRYRSLLQHPAYGQSIWLLEKILKSVKFRSKIWHETFNQISKARAKELSKMITRQDMEIAIERFTLMFAEIQQRGLSIYSDHLDVLVDQMRIAINACDVTSFEEHDFLQTIKNLFTLKEHLVDVQESYALPSYYKIVKDDDDDEVNNDTLIPLIDRVIGDLLIDKMSEVFNHNSENLKITYVCDVHGRRPYAVLKYGGALICELDHLPLEVSSALKELNEGILNDIVVAGLLRIKAKKVEGNLPLQLAE